MKILAHNIIHIIIYIKKCVFGVHVRVGEEILKKIFAYKYQGHMIRDNWTWTWTEKQ